MDNLTHDARIELGIGDLESQAKPNYRATAKKYEVNYTTLRRRFLRQQSSRQVANAKNHQCLTIAQEKVLIQHINKLTDRGLPPTSGIVRNLAEEIIGGTPVGKNWTASFVRRHRDRLRSLYLRNIDNLRTKADYALLFKQYYDLVRNLFYYFLKEIANYFVVNC